jgi:hypothetical protein
MNPKGMKEYYLWDQAAPPPGVSVPDGVSARSGEKCKRFKLILKFDKIGVV